MLQGRIPLAHIHRPESWIGAYLLSCGFQHLLVLPFFGEKFQLPECIFLLGLPLTMRWWASNPRRGDNSPRHRVFFVSVLCWCLVHCFSFACHPSLDGFLESLGVIYLAVLCLWIQRLAIHIPAAELPAFGVRAFGWQGWAMTLTALVAYLLALGGVANEAAQCYVCFPYFGDVYRLQGFTTTRALYLSAITLSIGFVLGDALSRDNGRQAVFAAGLFTLVAVLTFAKSFLYVIFLWVALLARRSGRSSLRVAFVGIVLTIVHCVATHLLIQAVEQTQRSVDPSGPYTTNERLFVFGDVTLVKTGYYALKRAAWQLFAENPWTGTGPGNFNRALAGLKTAGAYPGHLPDFDPHGSYTGALATLGLLGLLALLACGIALFRIVAGLPADDPFRYLFIALLAIMAAEAISMDVMNFRHYWALAGLILAWKGERVGEKPEPPLAVS